MGTCAPILFALTPDAEREDVLAIARQARPRGRAGGVLRMHPDTRESLAKVLAIFGPLAGTSHCLASRLGVVIETSGAYPPGVIEVVPTRG